MLAEWRRRYVGGTVSNHFMSFADKKWGVWPFLSARCDNIKRHDVTFPFAIDVDPKLFKSIGAVPFTMDSFPDDSAQLGVALDVVFDEAIVVQSSGNAGAPDGAASQLHAAFWTAFVLMCAAMSVIYTLWMGCWHV